MSEKRREVGRATVESDGHVYTLIVYQVTYDEWDDPEGRIDERFIAVSASGEPAWSKEKLESHPGLPAGEFNGTGRTVYDGGGRDRRHNEQLAERRLLHEIEHEQRLAKITDTTPTVEKMRCSECGHVDDFDAFDEPAYECSRCGKVETGEDARRCSDCNIFTARVSHCSCPSCQAPLEDNTDPETVVGYEIDGEFIPVEEVQV